MIFPSILRGLIQGCFMLQAPSWMGSWENLFQGGNDQMKMCRMKGDLNRLSFLKQNILLILYRFLI